MVTEVSAGPACTHTTGGDIFTRGRDQIYNIGASNMTQQGRPSMNFRHIELGFDSTYDRTFDGGLSCYVQHSFCQTGQSVVLSR